MTKPVAWGMRSRGGEILDVISPAEHDRYEGGYTVPLYDQPPLDNMGAAAICRDIWKNGGSAWDCWYALQARGKNG